MQGNKGEKRQNAWIANLRKILQETSDLDGDVRNILDTIQEHENIPRKKPKFINFVKEEEFLSLLGNIVEHTPKVALQLYKLKPFTDATALINSLSQAVDSLSQEEKVRSDHFIVRLTSVSMTSWES